MKHRFAVGVLVSLVCLVGAAQAASGGEKGAPPAYRGHPGLLERSKTYSQEVVARKPELGVLLRKLGLNYLYQLDPNKVYNLNTLTGEVTTMRPRQAEASAQTAISVDSIFGFGTPTAKIWASGSDIRGEGATTVTCPFAGQLAEVSGFMASTRTRDPVGGVRNGTLVIDDWLDSKAVVGFRIFKLPGGARNPSNRTTMETTHTGSCGDELRVANFVSTWPPLRVEMAIDDTGSMGEELDGAKSALASFIQSQQDSSAVQRGVSYELISFKDAPELRLPETEDSTAAIAAVQSLYASGGGDCPEDSLGALRLAVQRASADEDAEGSVVLVTDASPHSGDTGDLIAAAQAAGIKINVLLSGDCVSTALAASSNGGMQTQAFSSAVLVSARQVFEQVARETGGQYIYLPGATGQEYADVLEKIFSRAYASDTQPPVVRVTVTPKELWPANHKMIPISMQVQATDDQDPHPSVALESVISNEPADGHGDGHTSDDIKIAPDGAIRLRAERSGNGGGRIYTITYSATDASGNIGFGSAQVVVPHSK